MKAYLIDPIDLDVTEVSISNDYTEIYRYINCHTFTTVQINDQGDCIYVDDEGLLKNPIQQVFFMYEGFYHPLAGLGLVMGCDLSTGESRDPVIGMDEVIKKVSYMTPYQVALWLRDNQ